MTRTLRPVILLVAGGLLAVFAPKAPVRVHATFPGGNGRIAVQYYDSSSYQIATMNPDGSDFKVLRPGLAPRWSPDGTQIAFTTTAPSSLITVDADGSNPTTLATGTTLYSPAWSPDGRQIAYIEAYAVSPDKPLAYRIMAVEAKAGGTTRKILDSTATLAIRPLGLDWSPDGGRLLFTAGAGREDLFTVDGNGGSTTQLTNTAPDLEYMGRWSPDGTEILFLHFCGCQGGTDELQTIAGSGGNATTVPASGVDSNGAWSPDGKLIVYVVALTNGDRQLVSAGTKGGAAGTLRSVSPPEALLSPDWGPEAAGIQVEFTQATQELQSLSALQSDLAGDGKPPVPMLAGKDAVMRVYFPPVQTSTDYHIDVSGFIAASEDFTVTPGCSIKDQREGKPGCPSYDYYLTPPTGNWSVTLKITEKSTGDTKLDETFDLTSVDMPQFTIRYIPVCLAPVPGSGLGPICPTSFINSTAVELLKKIYPVNPNKFTYSRLPIPAMTLQDPADTDAKEHDLIASLRLRYDLMSLGSIALDQLAGWLPKDGAFDAGYSDPKWLGSTGRVTFSTDTSTRDALDVEHTLAHEIAHNLGMRHANLSDSCGARDPSTDWPSAPRSFDGRTYADSTVQETGFDVAAQVSVSASNKDLSTYCTPPGSNIWISPFSYMKLLNGRFNPQSLGGAVPEGATTSQFLLVKGSAFANGTSAQIDSSYVIDSAIPADPSVPDGNYCLHFTGGGDSDYCFSMEFVDHKTHDPVDSESFEVRVPLPAGTTHVGLVNNGHELDSLDLTANAPSVQLQTPGGPLSGEQTISWTASDGDSDALQFALMYSPDGRTTWYPLDVDETADSFKFDTSVLEGDHVLLRILASDGLHTTEQTSGPVDLTHGTPRIWGDVDCNGTIAPRDGQSVLNHFLGKAELSQTQPCPALGASVTVDGATITWGDTDCNGAVAPRDGQAVLNQFLGKAALPETEPCPDLGTTTSVMG
jgi:Tol biopolymer transport system component